MFTMLDGERFDYLSLVSYHGEPGKYPPPEVMVPKHSCEKLYPFEQV